MRTERRDRTMLERSRPTRHIGMAGATLRLQLSLHNDGSALELRAVATDADSIAVAQFNPGERAQNAPVG